MTDTDTRPDLDADADPVHGPQNQIDADRDAVAAYQQAHSGGARSQFPVADVIDAETRYRNQLGSEMYQRGRAAGRAEHTAETDAARTAIRETPDPVMAARIQAAADAEAADMDRVRYPPGGRASWLQPRLGDTQAAWTAYAQQELEAG